MSDLNKACGTMRSPKKAASLAKMLALTPECTAIYKGAFLANNPDVDFDAMQPHEQAVALKDYITAKQKEKREERNKTNMGISENTTVGTLYRQFIRAIPIADRKEVIEQISSLFSTALNYLCEGKELNHIVKVDGKDTHPEIHPEFKNMSRAEVLAAYGGKNNNGANLIFKEIGVFLDKKIEVLSGLVEGEKDITYEEGSKKQAKKEKRIHQLNTLLAIRKKGAWLAAIAMAKRDLLEIERLKLGEITGAQYAKFLNDAEEGELNLDDGVDDEILDAEDTTIEHWMKKADTTSSADGIAAEIRRLISRIHSNEVGLLCAHKRYDYDSIKLRLFELRSASKAQSSADFVEALTASVEFDKDPEFADFCKKLKDAMTIKSTDTDNQKREKSAVRALFFNNFNKAELTYTTPKVQKEKNKDGEWEITIDLTREGGPGRILAQSFQREVSTGNRELLENCIFNSNGTINLNNMLRFYGFYKRGGSTHHVSEVYPSISRGTITEYINAVSLDNQRIARGEESQITDDDRKNALLEVMRATMLNTVLDLDIDAIAHDPEAYEDFIRTVSAFLQQISVKAVDFNIKSTQGFEKLKDLMSILAESKYYTPSVRKVSVERSLHFDGSTYFATTSQFGMSIRMEQISNFLKSENKEGLKAFLEERYLSNPMFASQNTRMVNDVEEVIPGSYTIRNGWLQELYNYASGKSYNARFIEHLTNNTILRGIGYWNGYKPFVEFTELENMEFHMIHFLDEFVESKGKTGFIPSFVLGDADSVRYLPTTTLDFVNSTSYKQAFVDILSQEIQCANQIAEFEEWCKKDKDGNYSNRSGNRYKYLNEGSRDKRVTFAFFTALENQIKEGKTSLKQIESDLKELSTSELYDKYIAESIDAGYKTFVDTLYSKGLALIDREGHTYLNPEVFPKSYMEALNAQRNDAENIDPIKALFMNIKYGEIQHIQFNGISPAFYAGTKDMQKRWKEQVAPGTTLDRAAIDASTGNRVCPEFKQRVAYFKDEKSKTLETADGKESLFCKLLKKIGVDLSEYKKGSSLTDGQAYRSLESYRQIMIMRGEWYRNPANEFVYQKILYVREHNIDLFDGDHQDLLIECTYGMTKEEYTNLVATGKLVSKACFQPVKPFYYGMEDITVLGKGTFQIPVQHKYAERILIPELLPKGHKLRMMGEAMKEKHIDLLASEKCVKVGGWGQATLDFSSQEAMNASLAHETGCYHHSLDLSGYLIQTNVPNHMNTPRGEGTQERKIAGYTGTTAETIVEFDEKGNKVTKEVPTRSVATISKRSGITKIRLTDNENDVVDTENMSGKDCQRLFTALEISNWVSSLTKFASKISNPKALTKLIETCISNDNRTANDAFLGLDIIGNERLIPASEGIFASDIMAKILSVFRRDVIKQTGEGGTAVQVSSIGDDLEMIFDDECYEKDGDGNYVYDEGGKLKIKEGVTPSNVRFAEGAGTWDFHYTNASGRTVQLDYFKYVDPSTGRLLMKDKESGETRACRQGEEEQSLLNKEFPGIMDMLAYRVPTERAYSSINIRMVKFFPPVMGGVIAVPDAYTTIAGFDFDIDKLYLIRHSFVEMREEHYSDDEKIALWNYIFEKYKQDVYEPLKAAEYAAKTKALEASKDGKLGSEFKEKALNKYWEEAGLDKDMKELYFEEAIEDLYHRKVTHQRFYEYNGEALSTNPSHVIDNMKLDYFWDRMQSEETLSERYSPGGFYNIRKANPAMQRITRNELDGINSAKELFESSYEEPNDDPSNIVTVNHFQTANTIYGQLIGKAANQNISQKYVSMFHKFSLKSPIRFGTMIERAEDHDEVGRDLISRFKDGVLDSELLLAELLSSAVDAVKEATLEYFGITPQTFNIAATAIRLGATFEDVGLVLNQPVVREAILLMERGEERSFSSALDNAISQMMPAMNFKEVEAKAKSVSLDSETLFSGIKDYRGGYKINSAGIDKTLLSANEVAIQKAVIDQVIKPLINSSTTLTSLVQGTRQDSSNTVGSNEASIEVSLQSAKQLVLNLMDKDGTCPFEFEIDESQDKTLYTFDGIFNEDGTVNPEILTQTVNSPVGIPQMMLHLFRTFLDSINGEFASQAPGYTAIKDIVHAFTSSGVAPEEMIRAINEDLGTYILQRVGTVSNLGVAPEFDPNHLMTVVEYKDGKPQNKEIKVKEFLKYHFASTLQQMFKDHPEYREQFFIFNPDFMQIKSTKEGKLYLQFPNIGKYNGNAKDEIMNSWTRALQSEDPNVSKAARMLFFHNYHTRGTAVFGHNVCNSVTPVAVKLAIQGYRDISSGLKTLTTDADGNILYDEVVIGSINEFMELVMANRGSNMYQYTANFITNKAVETLKETSGDGVSALTATETAAKIAPITIKVGIDSPAIKHVSKTYNESGKETGYIAQVAPVIKVKVGYETRVYVLQADYFNEHNYVAAEVEKTTDPITGQAKMDYVVTATYRLVALNDRTGNRTASFSTDYSPFTSDEFLVPANTEEVYDFSEGLKTTPESAEDDSRNDDEVIPGAENEPIASYLQRCYQAFKGDVIVFDTETASKYDIKKEFNVYTADCDIIELSAARVRNGKIIDTFDVFIKSDKPIASEFVDKKGNVTKNPLAEKYPAADKLSKEDAFKKFFEFIGNSPMMGHNSDRFDFVVLENNLRASLGEESIEKLPKLDGRFDTIRLARAIAPSTAEGAFKLVNLIKRLNLIGENTHTSSDDVSATVSLLKYCMNNIPSKYFSLEDVDWKHLVGTDEAINAGGELLNAARQSSVSGDERLSECAKRAIRYVAIRAAINGQDALSVAKGIAIKEKKDMRGFSSYEWDLDELDKIAAEENLCP